MQGIVEISGQSSVILWRSNALDYQRLEIRVLGVWKDEFHNRIIQRLHDFASSILRDGTWTAEREAAHRRCESEHQRPLADLRLSMPPNLMVVG